MKFKNFLDWTRFVWFRNVFFPIEVLHNRSDCAIDGNLAAYDLAEQNNVLSSD